MSALLADTIIQIAERLIEARDTNTSNNYDIENLKVRVEQVIKDRDLFERIAQDTRVEINSMRAIKNDLSDQLLIVKKDRDQNLVEYNRLKHEHIATVARANALDIKNAELGMGNGVLLKKIKREARDYGIVYKSFQEQKKRADRLARELRKAKKYNNFNK